MGKLNSKKNAKWEKLKLTAPSILNTKRKEWITGDLGRKAIYKTKEKGRGTKINCMKSLGKIIREIREINVIKREKWLKL